jgi:(2Fe-2S) ferredoxin
VVAPSHRTRSIKDRFRKFNYTLDVVRRDRTFGPVFVFNWLVGREATIDPESSCELHAEARHALEARNGEIGLNKSRCAKCEVRTGRLTDRTHANCTKLHRPKIERIVQFHLGRQHEVERNRTRSFPLCRFYQPDSQI